MNTAESARTVKLDDYYVILPQVQIPAVEKKYKHVKRLGEFRYDSDTTRRMSKSELARVLKAEGWIQQL